jgi:hypothetical protein
MNQQLPSRTNEWKSVALHGHELMMCEVVSPVEKVVLVNRLSSALERAGFRVKTADDLLIVKSTNLVVSCQATKQDSGGTLLQLQSRLNWSEPIWLFLPCVLLATATFAGPLLAIELGPYKNIALFIAIGFGICVCGFKQLVGHPKDRARFDEQLQLCLKD